MILSFLPLFSHLDSLKQEESVTRLYCGGEAKRPTMTIVIDHCSEFQEQRETHCEKDICEDIQKQDVCP